MFQNEYRQETKNSTLVADFALTKGYKSKLYKRKNSISHLFARYFLDLDFEKFNKSDLNIKIEKVTNDTYLKLFDSNLIKSLIKPADKSKMTSNISLNLDHSNYDFNADQKVSFLDNNVVVSNTTFDQLLKPENLSLFINNSVLKWPSL